MSNTKAVKRGLPGEIETLDPHIANDNFSSPVVRDLYEGLTSEDRLGRTIPGVASNWTVSQAGTIYEFTIRPNAKWSNGDPVTAAEFVNGLRHAVDPRTASGSASLLSVVKGANDVIAGRLKPDALGVTAVGQDKVQIELERPAPYLLQILSEPVSAPMHGNPDTTTGAGAFKELKKIVVDGPYVPINRVMGSYIELKKNDYYWNAKNVAVDLIRYSTETSESTELHKYLAGEIDVTSTIPVADLQRLQQDRGVEIQSAPYLGTVYLALDTTKEPLSLNVGIRQALSMVIDREAIAQQVIVGVTPAYNFVAQGLTNYSPPRYAWADWPMTKRLQLAQHLYAEAGYSREKPLQLKLFYNSGEGIQRTMLAIAAEWKTSLGIESALNSSEFRVFLSEKQNKSKWDVLRTGWVADYDDPSSFLDIFTRSNPSNDPGFYDPSYSTLLKTAEGEQNQARRMQIFLDAEKLLLSSYAIIPIYFHTQRRLVSPYVGGAEITPLNHSRSQYLFWKQSKSDLGIIKP